ncbi:hypothetical protein DdX_19123 [Ditylenchus destructor]|uniref:Uncharacterized protein n=1 Tax=Ditylenchus destructor TaxID=166010 RepID=A0AAD4QSG0_9BILA|nr:hypothetical protein DdX_19123 [Ditylenchus destructor]
MNPQLFPLLIVGFFAVSILAQIQGQGQGMQGLGQGMQGQGQGMQGLGMQGQGMQGQGMQGMQGMQSRCNPACSDPQKCNPMTSQCFTPAQCNPSCSGQQICNPVNGTCMTMPSGMLGQGMQGMQGMPQMNMGGQQR